MAIFGASGDLAGRYLIPALVQIQQRGLLPKDFAVVGVAREAWTTETFRQRIAERLDVAGVLDAWRHGSVIRSWLVDLMAEAYRAEGGLDHIPPYVEDTGEVNWLVSDALEMEIAIPVITQAVMQLFASRDDLRRWARAIAMMRHGFGGHPYGPDATIARGRRTRRVGGFVRDDES